MLFSRKFKIRNPYKPDEFVTQELVVTATPTVDYSSVPWVAIDTEYLSFNPLIDQLCCIQIASPIADMPEKLAIETIWVYETLRAGKMSAEYNELLEKLAPILDREDIEVLMHVSTSDMPRLQKALGKKFQGKLFDTKVAGKIVQTNTGAWGMNDLISQLIDPKFTKDPKLTTSQWDSEPETWSDNMLEYSLNDVIYLHPLKEALLRVAERRGTSGLVKDTMAIMPTVCDLFQKGYTENVLSY